MGDTSLPVQRPEMLDDDLLRHLHHVLLEVSPTRLQNHLPNLTMSSQIHIDNGSMTCPNCGHVYPISNGIPNMVRILSALLRSSLVLIFLCISRFSYWRSTRSGSVLALAPMQLYSSRSCRWLMETQACIFKFYCTERRYCTCKLDGLC